MAPRRIAVFVAALCASSATTIHSSASEPFEIGVHLRVDPSITSRRIADRLKNEAEAIWGQYGIRLEWTHADAPEAAVGSVTLDAIVERRFKEVQHMGEPTVLGTAFVKPDAPNWRPVRVSFDATEVLLAFRTRRLSTAGIVTDGELARALGRVLAHEIGHVLLGAPYHDRTGLMRAAFPPDELAEPDRTPFRLTCSGVGRLRSRVRALTGHSQLVSQLRDSASLDLEGLGGTRHESAGEASCIATQPTR